MKNTVLKYYIIAFYLCSTFVMFGQPGSGSDNNGIDDNGSGDTTPGAPIDDYIWALSLLGLVLVFLKLRAIQKNRI